MKSYASIRKRVRGGGSFPFAAFQREKVTFILSGMDDLYYDGSNAFCYNLALPLYPVF